MSTFLKIYPEREFIDEREVLICNRIVSIPVNSAFNNRFNQYVIRRLLWSLALFDFFSINR